MTDADSGPHVMHVCWLPLQAQSGYRTRVVEETRLLTALRHKVVLAAFLPDWQVRDDEGCRLFRAELERQTGAQVHLLPTSHFFDLATSADAERELILPLSQLARDCAIQILHGQSIYAAMLALNVARRLPSLKVVFDCHGITPEENLMTGGNAARSERLERFERELLSGADLSVFVSERMAEHFQSKYGLRARRHVLIPCCVDLDKFSDIEAARPQARESLGLRDSLVIAYAGTLVAWQWPAAMFNAFAQIRRRIPSVRLLLLVPQRDHETAASLLEAAGVPAEAYVLREVPNAEIGLTLAAGDAGLLLRQDHPVNLVSSPTKFGEYMAAGMPVIATGAVGDFSVWIPERKLGVVVPVSDGGIAADAIDRVCEFLKDVHDRRPAWSARCCALAREQLSWHKRIQDLSRAYHQMIGIPVPGASSPLAAGGPSASPQAVRRTGRPLRVLFNGHDLKFVRPIIDHFSASPGYEVRVDEWKGHNIFDARQSEAMLPWADLIFCEWCLGNARWYSQRKRPGQRLIIRLHHQEMGLPYRYEIEWSNVDAIIFINLQHYNTFKREQPENASKATVIFNAIDCDALDRPKLPGAERNLGVVGINPMRKRPDLAYEILAKLRRIDSRYTLFFKSSMPWEYWWLWQRPHEREYFTRFFETIESGPHRNAAVFEGHGDDMPLWYSKIGFILSTSDHEGSHQAVAEGMAAGCVPIIRDWDGATPIYPSQFVFSSTDEAVELVRRFQEPELYEVATAEARRHARSSFDVAEINRQIEVMFSNPGTRLPAFSAMDLLPLYAGRHGCDSAGK